MSIRAVLAVVLIPTLLFGPRVSYSLAPTGMETRASGNAKAKAAPVVKAPSQKTLTDQRYHYELAKSALANDDLEKFEQHYALLGDYPLVPYLDYTLLKNRLTLLELDKINLFLETHKASFLETRLREQLLYTLAVKKRWSDFKQYYHEGIQSQALQCYALYARLLDRDTEVGAEIAELWSLGKSHPKACDPLFSAWRREGGLTPEIVWKRFDSAMQNGNRGLARYISSLMDEKYRAYAELYKKVDGYPYTIRENRLYEEQSLPMQQIIAHGIKRYSHFSPKDALTQWEKYEAQQLFPVAISTDAKRYIASRLVRKGEIGAAEQLISQSRELRDNAVLESFLRESLKQQQWSKVVQWLDMLEKEDQDSDRWLYWRARAQQELAITDSPYGSANDIFAKVAQNRSFYGFLASDILDRAYSLRHVSSDVSASTLLIVENEPAMRRARELWLLGSQAEAKAEWIFATRGMASQELIAAGNLARQWGWYNSGIITTISGNLWDHLSLRFPLAYQEEFAKVASSTNLEPSLIMAVARQESAFAEHAKSSAGAMGLMQLMPQTAQQTAKLTGVKHTESDLFNPEHNILLGSHYLSHLMQQYDGNRILAAAAYNAGPHRVNRWIKNNPQDVPFDIWIETIPFKETRGYVQNVLAFKVIYDYRMGISESSLITEKEALKKL